MSGIQHGVIRIAFASLLLAGVVAAAAKIAAAKDEGESTAPAPARQVLVVAKIRETARRRALEEAARIELKKRGVETLLGSDVMTEADFASEDTIRSKVESLGVDGVLGFVVLGIDETVKTSSASVSVGVGVGGYGHGGGMGMMVGASVPIGGQTTVVRTVHLRARFFSRPFAGPAWEKLYNSKLESDTTYLTQYLASDSVKALKKTKLIPAK
jgi:hypothetical protein